MDRQGYGVLVEKYPRSYAERGDPKMEPIERFQKPKELNYLDLHTKNFSDAIKANDVSILNNIQETHYHVIELPANYKF